jgi:hypothetical protein
MPNETLSQFEWQLTYYGPTGEYKVAVSAPSAHVAIEKGSLLAPAHVRLLAWDLDVRRADIPKKASGPNSVSKLLRSSIDLIATETLTAKEELKREMENVNPDPHRLQAMFDRMAAYQMALSYLRDAASEHLNVESIATDAMKRLNDEQRERVAENTLSDQSKTDLAESWFKS